MFVCLTEVRGNDELVGSATKETIEACVVSDRAATESADEIKQKKEMVISDG
jgi:hypothetical protein